MNASTLPQRALEVADTLTLEDVVRIATQNAYDVLSARQDARRAAAVLAEAQASLIPKLSFDASYRRYTKASTVQFDPTQPPIVVRPIDTASLALNITQPIDIFGVSKLAISGARNLKRASDALVVSAVNTASLKAKTAFFDVLRAEELATVADEQVKNANAQLKVAETKNQAGAAPRFDVVRLQSQVATAEQQRLQAQNNVDLAKSNLNSALSREVSTPVEVVKPSGLPGLRFTLEELTAKAKVTRPDVVAAAERYQYQVRYRQARQKANLPVVNVGATTTYDPNAGGLSGEKSTTFGTATLSFPIFDAGVNRARTEQARADEEKAKIALDQIVLGVTLEVRQAYLNVQNAAKLMDSAQKNVTFAQEAFRIANVRYDAQVGTQLEISDATVQLANARTALVNATYGYWQAVSNLQRAVGSEEV